MVNLCDPVGRFVAGCLALPRRQVPFDLAEIGHGAGADRALARVGESGGELQPRGGDDLGGCPGVGQNLDGERLERREARQDEGGEIFGGLGHAMVLDGAASEMADAFVLWSRAL